MKNLVAKVISFNNFVPLLQILLLNVRPVIQVINQAYIISFVKRKIASHNESLSALYDLPILCTYNRAGVFFKNEI